MTRSRGRPTQRQLAAWMQQQSNSNNNNNNAATFSSTRRRRRLFSCILILLALTIWSMQLLFVTYHLSRNSELIPAKRHSLVHGDHQRRRQEPQQRKQPQQQKLVASSSRPPLLQSRNRTNAELGKKPQAANSRNNDRQAVKVSTTEQEEATTTTSIDDDKNDIVQSYNCTNENGQLVALQQVPAFIIIGAQKAGTSALYDLLNLHPHLQGSREAEAHFFDRRLPINDLRNASSRNKTWAEQYRCQVRETYAKKFFPYEQLEKNPHLKFFDKTPDYIVSPGAPFRIQAIAPWSKIILSLRNPVHRAFSQYRMEYRPNLPHLTFEERVGLNLDILRQHLPSQYYFNNLPNTTTSDPFPRPSRELLDRLPKPKHQEIAGFDMWKHRNIIYRGLYLEQIQPWLQYYTLGKDLLVLRYEDFQHNPEKVLHQILDFVGVERHPSAVVQNSNGSTTAALFEYTPDMLAVQYGPGRLRGTPGEIAEVDPPLPASLAFLQHFYKPYNDALAQVLGQDEWQGVWD